MLCLSQTTGYAITALCCLEHSAGRFALARDIARRTAIPKPYLSKILHMLGQSGLVTTKRGYRGGFVLSRPAEQISVLEVVEAVEGTHWRSRCLMGLAVCSDERACPTHEFWKVERAKIEKTLGDLSLAEVAKFEAESGARVTDPPGARTRRKSGRRV